MNETRRQKNHKASKLGLATIAVHQSAVPPADHGSEVAIAAPSEAHAPMEPWPIDVGNFRQVECCKVSVTQAKSKLRTNEALRMRELRRTQR